MCWGTQKEKDIIKMGKKTNGMEIGKKTVHISSPATVGDSENSSAHTKETALGFVRPLQKSLNCRSFFVCKMKGWTGLILGSQQPAVLLTLLTCWLSCHTHPERRAGNRGQKQTQRRRGWCRGQGWEQKAVWQCQEQRLQNQEKKQAAPPVQ